MHKNGSWVDNGRLTSPVDRRTGQPQTVKVGPSGRLSFAIEAATDFDLWSDKDSRGQVVESGVSQDEIVSYTWKCSGGKFVTKDAGGKEQLVDSISGDEVLSATWVAWMSAGKARVWCEIDDAGPSVPNGDKGARDDEKLVREQSIRVLPPLNIALALTEKVICAGGQVVSTNTLNDPHVTQITATVTDHEGTPVAGKKVTFKWDMPGDEKEQTKEAQATNAQGQTTLMMSSGDTLGEFKIAAFYEEQPKPLEPRSEITVRVDAAQGEWLIKNESGQYVEWGGIVEMDGVSRRDLKFRLSFTNSKGKQPVAKHPVEWSVESVADSKGQAVTRNAKGFFAGYGRLSGRTSTTNEQGEATAFYIAGSRTGTMVFVVTDGCVYEEATPLARRSARKLLASLKPERILWAQTPQQPVKKRKKYPKSVGGNKSRQGKYSVSISLGNDVFYERTDVKPTKPANVRGGKIVKDGPWAIRSVRAIDGSMTDNKLARRVVQNYGDNEPLTIWYGAASLTGHIKGYSQALFAPRIHYSWDVGSNKGVATKHYLNVVDQNHANPLGSYVLRVGEGKKPDSQLTFALSVSQRRAPTLTNTYSVKWRRPFDNYKDVVGGGYPRTGHKFWTSNVGANLSVDPNGAITTDGKPPVVRFKTTLLGTYVRWGNDLMDRFEDISVLAARGTTLRDALEDSGVGNKDGVDTGESQSYGPVQNSSDMFKTARRFKGFTTKKLGFYRHRLVEPLYFQTYKLRHLRGDVYDAQGYVGPDNRIVGSAADDNGDLYDSGWTGKYELKNIYNDTIR